METERRGSRAQEAAWKAVARAVQSGHLTRPGKCEFCGRPKKKLTAHHWLGYDKAHRLDVLWFCGHCHVRIEYYIKLARRDRVTIPRLHVPQRYMHLAATYVGCWAQC